MHKTKWLHILKKEQGLLHHLLFLVDGVLTHSPTGRLHTTSHVQNTNTQFPFEGSKYDVNTMRAENDSKQVIVF